MKHKLPKKGSHYTDWDNILYCLFCPFFKQSRDYENRCHARESGGGRLLTADGQQRPPKWCRLREGPITINLDPDLLKGS
jgi:hypothetical protein